MSGHYSDTKALLETAAKTSCQQQVKMLLVDIQNLRWLVKEGHLGNAAYYNVKDILRRQHFLIHGNVVTRNYQWNGQWLQQRMSS
ncbi:hypothetical protein PQC41_gp097 [Escherichia phage vB_EcoP_SU7]|uniref:Uncharacterized protein n=1 Tax=Escherichia phage vB_EcoP_SU7 TaxID=2849626 RepID=A0A8F3C9E1_9CAUD|nr:hypothetical protein PQC41_gp097 [Escherichia phage vB_EcoP_SU7]QWY14194.1 hypothetical protein SU7_96 [Escherichia phage vB_EcoP_SU7]